MLAILVVALGVTLGDRGREEPEDVVGSWRRAHREQKPRALEVGHALYAVPQTLLLPQSFLRVGSHELFGAHRSAENLN